MALRGGPARGVPSSLNDCLCLSHYIKGVKAASTGFTVPHEHISDYGSNRGFFSIDRHGLPLAAPPVERHDLKTHRPINELHGAS